MKRLVCLLLLVVWLLAPIPPSMQHAGAYNYTSHLMYCRTELACLHEIGHRLDQNAGFVSQSAEFEQALQLYLYVELRQPQLATLPADVLALTYRGADLTTPVKQEIYAYLFAWVRGTQDQMPASLRGFYDWDTAQQLQNQLTPQRTLYWLP